MKLRDAVDSILNAFAHFGSIEQKTLSDTKIEGYILNVVSSGEDDKEEFMFQLKSSYFGSLFWERTNRNGLDEYVIPMDAWDANEDKDWFVLVEPSLEPVAKFHNDIEYTVTTAEVPVYKTRYPLHHRTDNPVLWWQAWEGSSWLTPNGNPTPKWRGLSLTKLRDASSNLSAATAAMKATKHYYSLMQEAYKKTLEDMLEMKIQSPSHVWDCPESPIKTCIYAADDLERDQCIFCGDPLERY